jgi:hypothetical protein
MLTLTTSFNLPAGSRLDIKPTTIDDEAQTMLVTVTLMSAPGTGSAIAMTTLELTNVESDKLARQTNPAVGMVIHDRDRYFLRTRRATPTGFTDALTAWRGGATMAARRTALEQHLLAAGHLDATLTGT